jgi:hypothetical protein
LPATTQMWTRKWAKSDEHYRSKWGQISKAHPQPGAGLTGPGSVRAVPDIGTLETGVVLATSDVDGGDLAEVMLFSGRGHGAG